MDDQNKNLLIATALSFAVILGWFVLFPPPDPALDPETALPPASETATPSVATTPEAAPADASTATQTGPTAVADAPRVAIETDRLVGSISLAGGRIDDLSLKDYQVSIEPECRYRTSAQPCRFCQPVLRAVRVGTGRRPDDRRRAQRPHSIGHWKVVKR